MCVLLTSSFFEPSLLFHSPSVRHGSTCGVEGEFHSAILLFPRTPTLGINRDRGERKREKTLLSRQTVMNFNHNAFAKGPYLANIYSNVSGLKRFPRDLWRFRLVRERERKITSYFQHFPCPQVLMFYTAIYL